MKFSEMPAGLAAFHVLELVLIVLGLAALVSGRWLAGLVLVAAWLVLLPALIARTRDPR
jgi:hypothetical protein